MSVEETVTQTCEVKRCPECGAAAGHKMVCETGRKERAQDVPEPENAPLLRELAEECQRFTVMLANAMESARDLRDRAQGVAVLGLREGFDDAAAMRAFHKNAVKYMVGAAARALAVDDLLAQLPE